MPIKNETTVVAGAGVVGLCCALQLVRDGHRVVLCDPNPPGSGCSRGNAGLISNCEIASPVNMNMRRELPRLLTHRDSPLQLKWRRVPGLARWLRLFLCATKEQATARLEAMTAIQKLNVNITRDFFHNVGAGDLLLEKGWTCVYRNAAEFAHAQHDIAEQGRRGIALELLDSAKLRASLPILAPHIKYAVHYPHVISVLDPFALCQRLWKAFRDAGGEWMQAPLSDIKTVCAGRNFNSAGDTNHSGGDNYASAHNNAGDLQLTIGAQQILAAQLVITAGVDSAKLLQRLNLRVPLIAERGYHLTVPQPRVRLSRPLLICGARIAITPMHMGLRITGISEPCRPHTPPDYRKIKIIARQAKQCLPQLDIKNVSEWSGMRPTLPDFLPAIGRLQSHPRILYAFGHAHIGLTLAAVTGRLITELASERTASIDLTPFRIERFL